MGFTQANASAGGQVIFLGTVVCGLAMTRLADALSSFLKPPLRLGESKKFAGEGRVGRGWTNFSTRPLRARRTFLRFLVSHFPHGLLAANKTFSARFSNRAEKTVRLVQTVRRTFRTVLSLYIGQTVRKRAVAPKSLKSSFQTVRKNRAENPDDFPNGATVAGAFRIEMAHPSSRTRLKHLTGNLSTHALDIYLVSRSYSEWCPIQTHTMCSPFRWPSARYCRPIRTDQSDSCPSSFLKCNEPCPGSSC
ncbi:hypothetical protein EV701_12757 [Chthoniobacter flavus]|nr:hypothetical protein EV701_12757 [Chthoniobacter flavus]